MEIVKNIDNLLYDCMPALGEKMVNAMSEDTEYQFSETFQRKMRILKNRAIQKERYGIPVESWKRAVAPVCVVLSGILMASLGVEAIRTEIYEYIQREYSKYNIVDYHIIKNESVEFVPLYPTYIPEGYTVNVCDEDEGYLYLSYVDATGLGFSIQQQQIFDGFSVLEDNEYIQEKDVKVLRYNAKICLKESGVIHVRWRTDTTWYCVIASNNMKEEDVLRICNSLKVKE